MSCKNSPKWKPLRLVCTLSLFKEKLMWLLFGNFWRKTIGLLFIPTSGHARRNKTLHLMETKASIQIVSSSSFMFFIFYFWRSFSETNLVADPFIILSHPASLRSHNVSAWGQFYKTLFLRNRGHCDVLYRMFQIYLKIYSLNLAS